MSEVKTKICAYCGQEKPLVKFRTDHRCLNEHTNRCKACERDHRIANGEYMRERIRKYQLRAASGKVTLTVDQLENLLQQNYCSYCGCKLSGAQKTFDHVYPLSDRYGGNDVITICCRSCNSRKSMLHVADFQRKSSEFTQQLWNEFVRNFGENLINRHLTGAEVAQLSDNLRAEADDLRKAHESA